MATLATPRVVVGSEKVANNAYTPQALMGAIAYTLDDTDPTTRPLTFVFNGGPGSSSVWLHMGLVLRSTALIRLTGPRLSPLFRGLQVWTSITLSALIFVLST